MTHQTVEQPERTALAWDTDVSIVPWYEDALSDPDYVRRTLASFEMGGHSAELLESIVSERPAASGPGATDSLRSGIDHDDRQHATGPSVVERLRDWLAGRTFDVLDSTEVTVAVPIFILTAPAVPDCTTTLTQSASATTTGGLSLKVLGTGFEASAEASIEVSHAMCVTQGDAERIYKDVTLEVEHVAIKERGHQVGVGYRHRPRRDTLKDRRPTMAHALPGDLVAGELLGTYALSGAAATATQTETLTYSTTKKGGLTIGFTALGNDQSLTTSVAVAGKLGLEIELRGGHHYEAYQTRDLPGVVWVVR